MASVSISFQVDILSKGEKFDFGYRSKSEENCDSVIIQNHETRLYDLGILSLQAPSRG